jgi:hypothetical protein
MADTKEGREEQAKHEQERQLEWEIRQARERADEPEPPAVETEEFEDWPPTCHRRGCDDPATFLVLERYLEETGKGPVEARAFLCRAHTAEESPTNLDRAYSDYVFRVESIELPDESET